MHRSRPHDVAQAIGAGQMELHLQPIVSADGHAVDARRGAHPLADHPVLGLVPPDAFIPSCRNRRCRRSTGSPCGWRRPAVAHYRRLAALVATRDLHQHFRPKPALCAISRTAWPGVLERMSAAPGRYRSGDHGKRRDARSGCDRRRSDAAAPEGLLRWRSTISASGIRLVDSAAPDAVLDDQDRQVVRRRPGDIKRFADDRALGDPACARHGAGKRGRRRGDRRHGAAADRAGDRQPARLLLQPAAAVRRVRGVAARIAISTLTLAGRA